MYMPCYLALLFVMVSSQRSFNVDFTQDCFVKDGRPFRYIAGAMHYFRVSESNWEDRFSKLRKAGLNAVQTYIAWNIHEQKPGQYDFTGGSNIEKYIRLAQQYGLLVILRPGPYIDAEWEFGGFPAWLLKYRSISIRSSKDAKFLELVDNWFSVLLPRIKPLLYVNGGPIITVQVENEYGSFGCDHTYMEAMQALYRKYLGNDVLLFTTDVAADQNLRCGSLPSLYRTVDFGTTQDVRESFSYQRKYQPNGPLVNSEFYTGWLDHWGGPHSRRNAAQVAEWLDVILSLNASVTLYLFEGGTSFGFMNGADQGKVYEPCPTSYDFDAPLTEAGDPTEKYFKVQEVISKYAEIPPGPQPVPVFKAPYGKVKARKSLSLQYSVDHVLYPDGAPYKSDVPLSFEEIDFDYGFVLYRTKLPYASNESLVLSISNFRDRATISVDQVFQGILDRNVNSSLPISSGLVLDILVENQGRVSYGDFLTDTAKGILGNVTLAGKLLVGWEMFPLGTEQLAMMQEKFSEHASEVQPSQPCFVLFSFAVDAIYDTYLKLDSWSKGVAMLNGFNLGRYWTSMGPQKTLYVPFDIIWSVNDLLLFETDRLPADPDCYVEFVDYPILGIGKA